MNENKFLVAVKAIIEDKGKYLVIFKSNEEDVNPNTYDIPGGGIEFGENPEDALKREVKEEVNLNIEIIRPTRTWTFMKKENTQLVGITFLCKYISGEVKLSFEHTGYEWLSYEEILNSDKLQDWLKEEIKAIK